MTSIVPTVGRIVHFWPRLGGGYRTVASHKAAISSKTDPWAAVVAFAYKEFDEHGKDRYRLHLTASDHHGMPVALRSVLLVQEGELVPPRETDEFATWMPYQLGQAAKTEAAMRGAGIATVTGNRLPELATGDAMAAAVQKPGLPRVSLADLEAEIVDEYYFNPQFATHVTLCLLKLRNGYILEGLSAPADAGNFDEAIGRTFAKQDALRKLRPIKGYMLCDHQWTIRNNLTAGAIAAAAHQRAHYERQKAPEDDIPADYETQRKVRFEEAVAKLKQDTPKTDTGLDDGVTGD